MDKIDIVIAADDNYAQHCCVLITSILLNNSNYFNFHILDGGISKKNKILIEELKQIKSFSINYYEMNKYNYSFLPLNRSWISISTYYRLFLTDILSDTIQKVLYLDCDIVVDGNILELWNEDINEFYAAVIEDESSINHAKRLGLKYYFNAGVLLLNLKKLRESDFQNSWIEYFKINENIITMQDQDILNGVFNNNVKNLPLKWNANTKIFDKKDNPHNHYYSSKDVSDAKKNRVIIHYTGHAKPWNFYNLLKSPYKKRIFYYLKEYLAYLISNIFYINNSDNNKHTVITIFGIKFKFKTRNKIPQTIAAVERE